MSFPRYAAYRDSGLNWIGTIPAHWNEPVTLGSISSLKGRLGWQGLKAEEYRDEGPYVVSSAHFSNFKIRWDECPRVSEERYETDNNIQLSEQDILLMKDGAAMGKLSFVDKLPGKACLNSHLLLFRPLYRNSGTPTYSPKFVFYYMQTGFFQEYIKVNGTGATFLGISQEAISRYRVCWPDFEEQNYIAGFLDGEIDKIDALISEQEKLIVLLTEKRQATISHAVTKGLNPDVQMKDSGLAWLGEVPTHWDVATFQRYVYVQEGQVNPEEEPYRSMVLIAPNHVESGTGRLLYVETAQEQSAESGKYLCKSGDVIYSKIRPALRKVCIAPEDCLCSADMYPLRGTSTLSNSFLKWFMLSEPFSALAVLESERVAMPKINRESLKAVWLPIPTPQEQEAIDFFLLTETAKLDSLKGSASQAIKLLAERRSALIAAAVTGQFDVRGSVQLAAVESPEPWAA